MGNLIAGDVGRLATASSVAPTDTALVYQGGKLVQATPAVFSAGGADVVGPSSATDNAVSRFDATTGKLIQNSVFVVADAGNTVIGDGTANISVSVTAKPTDANAGSLTVKASNATPTTATNRNGGQLVLSGGDSTGTGTSSVAIAAAPASGSGSSASAAVNVATVAAGAVVVNAGALDCDFTFNKLTSGTAINYDSGTDALTLNGATVGITGATSVSGALTCTTDKTDYQQFVGIEAADFANTVGTWTRTRIAEADYVLRHTATADTSVLCLEIDPIIRTTASKGFKLTSIDVIYKITTLALNAHTITLDLVNYANNAARTITSVPLTGSLSTATQTNEYVSNVTVTTPAFDVTTASVYRCEVTVNAQATSAYDFIGLNLKFTRNDL
jgi:hypothetical protein